MSLKETSKVATLFILGSVVGRAGNFIFRLLAAYFLTASEYSDFGIFARTIQFIIPFFGFELHSPLTRRLRINQEGIQPGFVWSYRITSVFGITCFSILAYFTIPTLTVDIYLLTFVSLILWGMAEYSLGVARGRNLIKESSFFTSLPGLLRLTLLVLLTYMIGMSTRLAIYSWVLSFGMASFYIIMIIGKDNKYLFQIHRPNWTEIKRNLTESVRVFLASFGEQGGFYIISLVAFYKLSDEMFRIFDLALVLLSLVSIVTSNLSLSILQQFSAKTEIKFTKKSKKLFGILIIGVLLVVSVLYLLLSLFQLDIMLFQMLSWKYEMSILLYIRLFIFVPPFMLTASVSHGLLQALGRYNAIAIFNLISLIIVSILSFLAFSTSIILFIPIGLLLGKVIQSIAYSQSLINS